MKIEWSSKKKTSRGRIASNNNCTVAGESSLARPQYEIE